MNLNRWILIRDHGGQFILSKGQVAHEGGKGVNTVASLAEFISARQDRVIRGPVSDDHEVKVLAKESPHRDRIVPGPDTGTGRSDHQLV